MNYKKALKYHLYSTKKAIFIMLTVTIILVGIALLVDFIGNNSDNGILNFNSMEVSYMVFLFILGIASYKTNFKFMQANGVSRKTQYLSFLSLTVIISLLFTIFNTFMGWILPMVAVYSSLFDMLFRGINGISIYILLFSMFLLIMNLGYFIRLLYYRMNATTRIIVSVGIAGFFFILFPIIDSVVFDNKISRGLMNFFIKLMGIETSNPYIGVLSMAVFLIIILFVMYLLNRRAVIEE